MKTLFREGNARLLWPPLRLLPIVPLLALTLFVGGARPADGLGGQAAGIALDRLMVLPEYCEYSQDGKYAYNSVNPSPAHQRWLTMLGSTLLHVHHYCRGLKAAMKARNPSIAPQTRMSLYGLAIREAGYVVERAPADFVLLPEIFLRMGQAAFEMGEVGTALAYFDRSRQTKPDYWPAYLEIARTNESFGRREEAKAALKAGLQAIPGNAQLMKALDHLSPPSDRIKRAKPATAS
jgi:tetratricopeptide (TPR) repeat protein